MPTCCLGLAKKGKEKEKPKNSRKERSWTWGPARTKERKMNEVCATGGTDVEKRQEKGSEKQLREEKEYISLSTQKKKKQESTTWHSYRVIQYYSESR